MLIFCSLISRVSATEFYRAFVLNLIISNLIGLQFRAGRYKFQHSSTMRFFKKIFGKGQPSRPIEPVFPGERYTIVKLEIKDGLALATVNNAYDNYANKAFYPWFVGVELQVIDKNDNGHPTDEEAARLNIIQEELETFLKEQHTVHSIARVTRNGFRDIMMYIDKPKLTQEEVNNFFNGIQKDREVNFGIHQDSSWNAVSGFIK
jgi:hypothetical protein